MKRKNIIVILCALATLTQGCAHGKTERDLDQKISNEAEIPNSAALSAKTEVLLQSAPGLTDDQRTQLKTLKIETQQKMKDASELSLKLRLLLYQDLVATPFNRSEVNLLKSKIQNAEKKRVSILLDAVEKANTILGHDAANNKKNLDSFYFEMLHPPSLHY